MLPLPLLVVALVIPFCPPQAYAGAQARPNMVLILADDLDIDRLAAEGMRFTQFYSGNAVCAPSRCA